MAKNIVAVSLLGTQLDFVGKRVDRWSKWRPNICLCAQEDMIVGTLHLLHDARSQRLATQVVHDIGAVSPEETVISFEDPWDLEEVYSKLYDWFQQQTFDTDENDYVFHITTGTHVAQICIYLLTESHHFPGRLIQTSPTHGEARSNGHVRLIDLDLGRYDQISSRFKQEHLEGEDFLKGGIATRNKAFNALIEQIEKVAVRSTAPILLTGPTGAGKSQLASRIFELKKVRQTLPGKFVSVNCATLQGTNAMAALFGHTKGAFTGAQAARDGFLFTADKGVLFLDEIGELGLDEQAMLLHALETKSFYPVGSDKPRSSNFQLITGTNRDLKEQVLAGKFREDLLSRIHLWTYQLPALKDRREDIEPNLQYELREFTKREGVSIDFNKEARSDFIKFALSPKTLWQGNFRDLNAAVTRLSTLASGARINAADVKEEITRLQSQWIDKTPQAQNTDKLAIYLSEDRLAQLDSFDKMQLAYVLFVCERHPSMASAGRELFDVSRTAKKMVNDSSRLQKYLTKFEVNCERLFSKNISPQ
jgi:transcriptional regulatory protein RtcR